MLLSKLSIFIFLFHVFTHLSHAQEMQRDTIGTCIAKNSKYNCVIALHFNPKKKEISGHYNCFMDKARNVYAANEIELTDTQFQDILIKKGKMKLKKSLIGLMFSKFNPIQNKRAEYEVYSEGISYNDGTLFFEVAQGNNSLDETKSKSTLQEFDMLTGEYKPVELSTSCHFAF